jgi:hypothetical protein
MAQAWLRLADQAEKTNGTRSSLKRQQQIHSQPSQSEPSQ